jgi:5'(3')-deoxyribonucleotidase
MSTQIAIDMDEVLADTLSKHLATYNLEHGDTLTSKILKENSSMRRSALIEGRASASILARRIFLGTFR